MAPVTYKGLRKPGDPLYNQITIVLGPAAKLGSKKTSKGEPDPKKATTGTPTTGAKTNKGRKSLNEPLPPDG